MYLKLWIFIVGLLALFSPLQHPLKNVFYYSFIESAVLFMSAMLGACLFFPEMSNCPIFLLNTLNIYIYSSQIMVDLDIIVIHDTLTDFVASEDSAVCTATAPNPPPLFDKTHNHLILLFPSVCSLACDSAVAVCPNISFLVTALSR